MTILGDIIQDLATDKLVEQVHMICQRIKEEEQVSFEYIEYASEGPNIFLTLEVPGRNKKEVGFLSLEREGEEIYLSIYSTLPLINIGVHLCWRLRIPLSNCREESNGVV